MGFQFTALQPIVTVTGSIDTALPQPSAAQTLKNGSSAPAGGSYATLTVDVGAGKTFYLMGLFIVVTTQGTLNLRNGDGGAIKIPFGTLTTGTYLIPAMIPLSSFTEDIWAQGTSLVGTIFAWGYEV